MSKTIYENGIRAGPAGYILVHFGEKLKGEDGKELEPEPEPTPESGCEVIHTFNPRVKKIRAKNGELATFTTSHYIWNDTSELHMGLSVQREDNFTNGTEFRVVMEWADANQYPTLLPWNATRTARVGFFVPIKTDNSYLKPYHYFDTNEATSRLNTQAYAKGGDSDAHRFMVSKPKTDGVWDQNPLFVKMINKTATPVWTNFTIDP